MINKQNYKSLINFCNFAIELGIKEVYVTPIKIFEGFQNSIGDYVIDYSDEQNEVLTKAKGLLQSNNIRCGGFEKENEPRYACFENNFESPVIDVTGDVSFCCGREDVIVANITDSNFDDKWQTIYDRLKTQKIWCKNCGNNIQKNGRYYLPKTIDLEL